MTLPTSPPRASGRPVASQDGRVRADAGLVAPNTFDPSDLPAIDGVGVSDERLSRIRIVRVKSNATTSTMGREGEPTPRGPYNRPTVASDWVCAEFLISPAQRFELPVGPYLLITWLGRKRDRERTGEAQRERWRKFHRLEVGGRKRRPSSPGDILGEALM